MLSFLSNKRLEPDMNTKYSTKDLKGGHTGKNLSILDTYLNEKRPYVKIQLLNVFKDYEIVAKSSPTPIDYNAWLLSKSFG